MRCTRRAQPSCAAWRRAGSTQDGTYLLQVGDTQFRVYCYGMEGAGKPREYLEVDPTKNYATEGVGGGVFGGGAGGQVAGRERAS